MFPQFNLLCVGFCCCVLQIQLLQMLLWTSCVCWWRTSGVGCALRTYRRPSDCSLAPSLRGRSFFELLCWCLCILLQCVIPYSLLWPLRLSILNKPLSIRAWDLCCMTTDQSITIKTKQWHSDYMFTVGDTNVPILLAGDIVVLTCFSFIQLNVHAGSSSSLRDGFMRH